MISTDVKLMSHFMHLKMLFNWFSSVMHELIFHNISEKEVRTIHKAKVYTSFKGMYKGCVLYTGASYTRKITV